jgi:hypothetical protein
MREVWSGLLGRGDWRDLSWAVPALLAVTLFVVAAVMFAAM